MITIMDVAIAEGAKEVEGRINGAEFVRLGLPIMAGCEVCYANLGAYNAYPTKTGFIRCHDCVGERGFEKVEEFKAWMKAH